MKEFERKKNIIKGEREAVLGMSINLSARNGLTEEQRGNYFYFAHFFGMQPGRGAFSSPLSLAWFVTGLLWGLSVPVLVAGVVPLMKRASPLSPTEIVILLVVALSVLFLWASGVAVYSSFRRGNASLLQPLLYADGESHLRVIGRRYTLILLVFVFAPVTAYWVVSDVEYVLFEVAATLNISSVAARVPFYTYVLCGDILAALYLATASSLFVVPMHFLCVEAVRMRQSVQRGDELDFSRVALLEERSTRFLLGAGGWIGTTFVQLWLVVLVISWGLYLRKTDAWLNWGMFLIIVAEFVIVNLLPAAFFSYQIERLKSHHRIQCLRQGKEQFHLISTLSEALPVARLLGFDVSFSMLLNGAVSLFLLTLYAQWTGT